MPSFAGLGLRRADLVRWTYLTRSLSRAATPIIRRPGGPTNFGITIYDYRKYVKPGATAADVRAMKLGEAKAIYRTKYWTAQRCDDLPPGVDDSVFDYGVNSGIDRSGRSYRGLQRRSEYCQRTDRASNIADLSSTA